MREILFKGKRKDNGEWVEGDLFHNDNTNYPMTLIGSLILSRNKYTDEIDIDGYCLIEVDPETVCQYTGLKDRNGKKIFEGDIVDTVYDIEYIGVAAKRIGKSVVKFHKGCFMKDKIGEAGLFHFIASDKEKVIGNIFDNPELLEVTE